MKNPGNVTLMYWFNFFLYFRPHWPIAVIYFEGITGSYSLAMTVFSVVFVSQAALEIPTGLLSDRMGRKHILALGALFSFFSLLLYAAGMHYWILALGGLCEGMSRALLSGTKSALLFETLKDQGQQDSFDNILGKTNSAYQLALGISALVSAVLATYSLSLVLWISVVPQFLCLLVALFFIETRHVDMKDDHMFLMLRHAWSQFMASRRLRMISLAEIVEFGFGEAMFYFQAAFFNTVIPQWMIGIVRCFTHFCSAVSFWFSGHIIKRLGYRLTLVGGNILVTVVDAVAVLFPTVLSPFLMASGSLVFGASSTARSSLMQQEFSEKQRATMDSMVSLAGSLLFAAVSTLLGLIADATSPVYAILAGMSSSIVVILLYEAGFRKKQQP